MGVVSFSIVRRVYSTLPCAVAHPDDTAVTGAGDVLDAVAPAVLDRCASIVFSELAHPQMDDPVRAGLMLDPIGEQQTTDLSAYRPIVESIRRARVVGPYAEHPLHARAVEGEQQLTDGGVELRADGVDTRGPS